MEEARLDIETKPLHFGVRARTRALHRRSGGSDHPTLLRSEALTDWFARPVLFVADVDRSVDFYVSQLGFTQAWRFEEDSKAHVAQVDRQGCALILSSQWPDKVGKGLIFVSLNVEAAPDKLRGEVEAALDKLRAELESRGVDVKDGYWGYPLLVVHDLDGNELYFSYPSDEEAPAADKA
jgi:catechol 2,3-dioxygenase-like lactoylglutathione lyase family enzyme